MERTEKMLGIMWIPGKCLESHGKWKNAGNYVIKKVQNYMDKREEKFLESHRELKKCLELCRYQKNVQNYMDKRKNAWNHIEN